MNIGQLLKVKAKLIRIKSGALRFWERQEFGNNSEKVTVFKYVHYIGQRTIQNGKFLSGYSGGYDSQSEPPEFIPSEYVKAYLVVENDRTKPFLILPEDIMDTK